MLTITRRDLGAIYQQALDEHPDECCGLLTRARDEEVSRVHQCANVQGPLHARNPQQYPGDSGSAYFLEPQAQIRIIASVENAGGRVSGIYHSHIDCEAHFSDRDREGAVAWDQPAYAGAVYLVISVFADGVRGHRAFAWDEDESDFAEVDIAVVE